MPSYSLQLTIGAGPTNLSTALQQPSGGPGNLVGQQPIGNVYVQWMTFQYNGANTVRYGVTNKVSILVPAAVNGGIAGFGILLFPTGSGSQSTPIDYSTYLSEWWFAGVLGDVVDILCLQ